MLFLYTLFTEHVYCTETRPYNQGARLTAYELVHDKIPATLIVDSMVGALMKQRNISAVVVGADRVCTGKGTFENIFLQSKILFIRLPLMEILQIK